MAYSVSNNYKQVIYSQNDENDIKIWFNNTELEDAGYYVEKVTVKSRILPEDGTKRFSLDNFISKEVDVILHNVNLEDIQDQVQISIGTLVGNNYEYVPLGIFNIQETPENNNNTITLKLRDNRVKFDFGYNAQYLIDTQYKVTTDTNYLENKAYYSYSNDNYVLLIAGTDYQIGDAISGTVYEKLNSATYLQILEDICSQAGVTCDVESFDGDDIVTGMYDSTISASAYVSYIAEQGGYIPVITRDGHLDFVDLNESDTWQIPLSIVSDNYQVQESYNVERVVYESGVIKFQTSDDETESTLYLNAANPYIVNQDQVDDILDKFEDFSIDSVKLTTAILGNPAIDSWDYIEVYDDENNNTVIFKTLANSDYTFNGKHRQLFTTEIGKEERTENVTIKSEATSKKLAKTDIDEINAQIQLQAESSQQIRNEIQDLEGNISENYYTKSVVNQLIVNAENGVTNTFSEAGGNNILRNTNFSAREVLEQGQYYEYWYGDTTRDLNNKAVNGYSIKLKNDTLYQQQNVINGTYTLSFYYKKLNSLATCQVKINDKTYPLTETSNYTLFQTGINGIDAIIVNANSIKVEFISDSNDACEIYDIMLNIGTIKLAYSQNANETITDTVNISRGITITSSTSSVKFTANNYGISTKTLQGQDITTFTYKGMTTKEAVISDGAEIVGILRQKVDDQIWDSMI